MTNNNIGEKTPVNVSIGHKNEFDSIVNLQQNLFAEDKQLQNKIRQAIPGRIVSARGEEFVLTSDGFSRQNLEMKQDGASWFGAFRKGGSFSNPEAGWKTFVEDIRKQYHDNYSFLEFKQQQDDNIRRVEEISKGFFELIRDIKKDITLQQEVLVEGKQSDAPQDVYGLSLRLNLVPGGTGEACPVLCRVYFSYSEGSFVPYPSANATMIDKLVGSMDDDGANPNGDMSESVGPLLNALANMWKMERNDNAFTDYVVVREGSEDEIVINKLIDGKGRDPGKPVFVCSRVELLGVSHVKWNNSERAITCNGERVLLVTVLGNSLSLKCLNCGKMLFNGVTYDSANQIFADAEGELTTQRLTAMLEDHLNSPPCFGHVNVYCPHFVCRDPKDSSICFDCKDPTKMYVDLFDPTFNPILTKELYFDFGELKMKPADQPHYRCSCCDKIYSGSPKSESDSDKFCDKCDPTYVGDKLSNMVAGILPPHKRLRRNKTYIENKSLIVIHVGKDVYVFDKLNAQGLVHGPKRFRPKRFGR